MRNQIKRDIADKSKLCPKYKKIMFKTLELMREERLRQENEENVQQLRKN